MKKACCLFVSWVAMATTGIGQGWFNAPQTFEALDPIETTADLNQDGSPDLVRVAKDRITTWLNDGSGSFTAGPVTIPNVSLEHLPLIPRLLPVPGDINGDGIVDLAFAVHKPLADGIVAVFFGQGGGQFNPAAQVIDVPKTAYVGSGFMTGIALGDIDADGAMEIVEAHDMSPASGAANARSDVTWWDWNGASFTSGTPLPVSATVLDIAAGDLDGDNVADTVVVGRDNAGDGRAYVLPTLFGDASFGPHFTLESTITKNVRIADLDSDGDNDVAIASRKTCPNFNVTVLQNDGPAFSIQSSGLSTFAVLFCTGFSRFALGDWDNDGDLDLSMGEYQRLTLFLNDGTNKFTFAGSQPSTVALPAASFAISIDDLDNDGHPDLVDSSTLLFGDGEPLAIAPSLPSQVLFKEALPYDYEDDGDSDLFTDAGVIAINNASGHFETMDSVFPIPPAGVSFHDAIAIDDFTGDGFADFLVPATNGKMYLIADNGLGAFTASESTIQPALEPFQDGALRVGYDVDGDGDLDLPYHNGYWPAQGAGFGAFVPLAAVDEIADLADFDGDGDTDLLTLDSGNSGYSLRLQSSPGVFTTQTLVVSNNQSPHGIFADLDDDGDVDIALPSLVSGGPLRVFENLGGLASAEITLEGAGPSLRIFATDVDQDGLTDLVGSRNSTAYVFRRSGSALTFEPIREYLTFGGDHLIDVDGDGDADVLGNRVVDALVFDGALDGAILQYGFGTAGSGGAVPIIGATGPLRTTSNNATLRVRRALGGAAGFFLVGLGDAAQPGVIPFATLWVSPPLTVVPFPLGGSAGVAGAGEFTIDIGPLLPTVAGLTFYHQLAVIDPGAPGGVASTLGLRLAYGL